ncbi:MAG: hypothetical protein ABSD74_19340 [Rhizomicrobium sp.]|jgi:hypothetical protein
MKAAKSEDVMDKFVRHWGRLGKFRLRGEEIEIFPAIVTYYLRGKEKSIKTTVQLYFDGRKVELIPSGWLDTDHYYTGFDPRYQTFSIEAGHILRIRGTGEKVGGAYQVDILPE